MTDKGTPAKYLEDREESLQGVQKLIMSFLAVAISLFPIGGLIFGSASVIDEGRTGAGICLVIMAGIVGVGAFVGTRLIYGKSPLSPILLLGTIPAVVASFFLF